MSAEPDGVRLAHVTVNGQQVTVCFWADLTPVEVVAAFLRDLADAADNVEAALLYDVAEQLDPMGDPS